MTLKCSRPHILIVTPCYLPGYKAGGPVRTIANTIERLGDEFDFDIITMDRDLGDKEPYTSIDHGKWQRVGSRAADRHVYS